MSIDNITKSDLERLDFLYLMLDEDSPSLDFLKYCKNLKSLSINLKCDGVIRMLRLKHSSTKERKRRTLICSKYAILEPNDKIGIPT